ncbi:hypothetical protein CR513_39388, partial [Mucuna pruriens]
MAGGATTSALVIPYYAPFDHLRNSIQTNIWHRCYDPVSSKRRRNDGQSRFTVGVTHIKEYATKAKVPRYYNTKVFPQKLKKQDLVLKRVFKDKTSNKLTPNWEGPYRIEDEVGKGAYRIEHLDGWRVPRTWNLEILRIYYN